MNQSHFSQQYIEEQERMLYAQHGLKISIGVYRDHFRVSSWGEGEYELKFETAIGDTVGEAVDKLLAKFPNKKQRIAQLREQASKLMTEAAAIEREEAV